MDQNKLRKFCERHDIRVLDNNKRVARYQIPPAHFFQYSDDYNKITEDIIKYETEILYTVEIPERDLERMAEFEEQVFNNMEIHGHYNLFETVMEQKRQESYLANKYPAVKKAYEQYSLMLKLAKSGEL